MLVSVIYWKKKKQKKQKKKKKKKKKEKKKNNIPFVVKFCRIIVSHKCKITLADLDLRNICPS